MLRWRCRFPNRPIKGEKMYSEVLENQKKSKILAKTKWVGTYGRCRCGGCWRGRSSLTEPLASTIPNLGSE